MEESIETMYEMLYIAYTEEVRRNAKLSFAFDILDEECSRFRTVLEHIGDPFSPECCRKDGRQTLARHYEDLAYKALGPRK